MQWIIGIVVAIINAIGGILIKKKEAADKSEAEAAKEALATVGDSLQTEDNVEDAQNKVDEKPSDVQQDDGGLNFDAWNTGEKEGTPKKEENKNEN